MTGIFDPENYFLSHYTVHNNAFSVENAYFLVHFRLSSTLNARKTGWRRRVFFRHRFQKPPISPHENRSVFKMMLFRKAPILKPFLKTSTCNQRFCRFSLDDRRKHSKNYAFEVLHLIITLLFCPHNPLTIRLTRNMIGYTEPSN